MGDLLHSVVGSVRPAEMRPRQSVARRISERLSPPDCRGVEHEVILRAGIDRRRPLLGIYAALPGCAASNDLQSGDIRGVAMVLPANKAGTRVTVFQPTAIKHPVVRSCHGPVAAAVHGLDIASPHQQTFIRASMRKRTVFLFPQCCVAVFSSVRTSAEEDSIWLAGRAVSQRAHPAHAVAGQKQQTDSFIPHSSDAVMLAAIPVFIVPDADERLALQAPVRREHVAVRAVRDVVSMLFEPIRHRKFVRQKLTGSHRQRIIHNRRVLSLAPVWPVKTDIGPRSLAAFRMRVDGIVTGPDVVRLPGVVRNLKQNVRRTLVTDDENDVALPIRFFVVVLRDRGESAEIHTAEPFVGNCQSQRRRPTAFVQIFFANDRLRLSHSFDTIDGFHEPCAATSVVASSKELDPKITSWS